MTRAWQLLCLALAALSLSAAASAVDLDESLASLRSAAARHPQDADYSWAVGDALEAAGRPSEAAEQMRSHLTRWPERPRGGWRALGRCEYHAARFEPARDALREAVWRNPSDAEAQLYLGLALQALGDSVPAAQHLEMAAALDPAVARDALLLAGISEISGGNKLRGYELLERVISISPDSNSAREAQTLIDHRAPSPPALGVQAYAGVSYDSNVTLGGEGDLPGAGQAEDDAFVESSLRVSWRPSIGERRPIEIGASYDRSDYLDLDEFSSQRAGGDVGWTLPLLENVALRLSGVGAYYWLGDQPYLIRGAAAPSLYVALGDALGVLRIGGSAEYLDYDEKPIFESLERDGWEYGGFAEHMVPLPLFSEQRKAWFSWGGGYSRRATDARRDVLGFASAYDRDRWRGNVRALVPLVFGVDADASLIYDAELYDNDNLIDALTENPISPDRRRDSVWSSTLSLRRNLLPGVYLEVLASYQDRNSNVDLYSYRRTVAGMRLYASYP